jgi:hypothetical protein
LWLEVERVLPLPLFLALAKQVAVAPITKVNARKLERMFFMQ